MSGNGRSVAAGRLTHRKPSLFRTRGARMPITKRSTASLSCLWIVIVGLMIEKACNLWIEAAEFRCIPTTGAVQEGEAVMDEGVAKEAADRFHNIQIDLGRLLTSRGNHVHELRPGLLSFPIKQYAWSTVTIPVLQRSVEELKEIVGDKKTLLPRPPLGPSDPSWDEIKSVFADLPDNVIVIQHA